MAPARLTDYSQADVLVLRYESVTFETTKSPGSPHHIGEPNQTAGYEGFSAHCGPKVRYLIVETPLCPWGLWIIYLRVIQKSLFSPLCGRLKERYHTVEYDTCIKSQLASRN